MVDNCCHEYAKLANVATSEFQQIDDVAFTCFVHLLENEETLVNKLCLISSAGNVAGWNQ